MYATGRTGLRLEVVNGAVAGSHAQENGAVNPDGDGALNVLRGWFIVMMVIGHVGGLTRVSAVAHLPVYLSAAYGFLLLAGVTFGLSSQRFLDAGSARAAYAHVWKRTAGFWVLHCLLALSVVLLHQATGRLPDERSIADLGGWSRLCWLIPSLRLQPLDYMNLLPTVILCLLGAPLALVAIRRGQSVLVAAVSAGLYVIAQFRPEFMRVTAPISGRMECSTAAWQILFFGGLLFGYHLHELRERKGELRRPALWVCAAIFGLLFLYAQTQRHILSPLHVANWLPPTLFNKPRLGPLALVYCVTGSAVFYAILQRLLSFSVAREATEWLALMGRASLFCFVAHLGLAVASRFFGTWSWPLPIQEVLTVASVGVVYAAARLRIKHEQIGPPELTIVEGGGGNVRSIGSTLGHTALKSA